MFNILKKKNKASEEGKEKQKSVEKVKINKDVIVHVMPERFRFSHVKASGTKKAGLFIIIAGAIFLLAIIGGLYYYFFVMQPSKPGQAPAATSTLDKIEADKIGEPAAAPKSEPPKPDNKLTAIKPAKETYLSIKGELDLVNTFAGYEQVIRKHGSKSRILKLEKQKQEYNNLSDDAKSDFIVDVIQSAPKLEKVQDIKEEVIRNKATLSITIQDIDEKGIIIMAIEESEWKLESENWPELKSVDDFVVDFTAATDSDDDGLTDKEEALLGCDSSNIDSDGDGYNDLSEIMSLYNPAGADKLINNSNISKYLNNSFNYSMLYPANWLFSAVGGDDSIMFRSSDNQFIQVIAQANAEKESIANWYKKQFNADIIDSVKLIITDNWQGIKSEDGLTIYLTDKQHNNIITITYIPGQDNVLDYINIFEMVIKSLEISN